MLEKAVDDRDDLDILAEGRHTGPEGADPPHVEADLHAVPGSGVQRVDDLFINQNSRSPH
jgi:hypothetical protein